MNESSRKPRSDRNTPEMSHNRTRNASFLVCSNEFRPLYFRVWGKLTVTVFGSAFCFAKDDLIMMKKGISENCQLLIIVTGMILLVFAGSELYNYIISVLIYSSGNLEIRDFPLPDPISHFKNDNHVMYGVWALAGFTYWAIFMYGFVNWPAFKKKATISLGEFEFTGQNGIIAWLFMYGLFVFGQNMILGFIPGINLDNGLDTPKPGDSHWIEISVFYFSIILFYPFVEEFFFRGFLYDAVRRLSGIMPAILLSSTLFAIMHISAYGMAPVAISLIFFDGLFWCYCRYKTGGIICPFFLHASSNLSAV